MDVTLVFGDDEFFPRQLLEGIAYCHKHRVLHRYRRYYVAARKGAEMRKPKKSPDVKVPKTVFT